jgi:hypothetical protein
MKILDRLPFRETRSEFWTPDGPANVKPYQIIVTISLSQRERIEPDPGMPRFPAVFPEDLPNPARLPILGLRALVNSELRLIIDGKRREVTLKTSGWL